MPHTTWSIDQSLLPVVTPGSRFQDSEYRVQIRRSRWRAAGASELTDNEVPSVERAESQLAKLWMNGGAIFRIYDVERVTRAPLAAVPPESADVLGCLADLASNCRLPDGLAGCSLEYLKLVGLHPMTPRQAVTALFEAYRCGGAYSSGLPEETARGLAEGWAAVAFAGDVDGQTVVRALHPGFSVWFRQVAWDLALVNLNPAGGRLALVFATDTD